MSEKREAVATRERGAPKRSQAGSKPAADTRARIIDAALESLKADGYAGTSVRSIARRGDFNSALIFYYYGSLNGLLLAALDHTSAQRMTRYQAAVDAAGTLEELVTVAATIYREDVEAGHITVFSELVGASMSQPELGPEIVARAEPWIDFVEGVLRKVIVGTPFEQLLPTRDVAFATIAFYLGVNLLTHLEEDTTRIDELFRLAAVVAPLVSPMLVKEPR